MNDKLQEIENENFIIGIYFILLTIYLYANTIEVKYLKYKKVQDKENYRLLLYIVFGTTFIITLYYTITNLNDLKKNQNIEVQKLKELSTIATILILISTIIYLYIIHEDKNINLEVNL